MLPPDINKNVTINSQQSHQLIKSTHNYLYYKEYYFIHL